MNMIANTLNCVGTNHRCKSRSRWGSAEDAEFLKVYSSIPTYNLYFAIIKLNANHFNPAIYVIHFRRNITCHIPYF